MLTGCGGYVGVQSESVGVQAPVYVAADANFAPQDDYVYYPEYQVYYSVNLHQYAYRNGDRWIARPAPVGVSVDALRASHSVKMDFHDSPANHHANVVKQYPKTAPVKEAPKGKTDKDKTARDNDRP